jgi:mRNA deadenylase 3'-5' endonuclease subunit Ccr4
MCLQEVDLKHFTSDFLPIFEKLGFVGLMKQKGQIKEGTATFIRSSKFR